MTYCKGKVLFINNKCNTNINKPYKEKEMSNFNEIKSKNKTLKDIPLFCNDDSPHIITLSEFKTNLTGKIMSNYLDVSKHNKYLVVNKSKSKSV